jgi:hypothetical protein
VWSSCGRLIATRVPRCIACFSWCLPARWRGIFRRSAEHPSHVPVRFSWRPRARRRHMRCEGGVHAPSHRKSPDTRAPLVPLVLPPPATRPNQEALESRKAPRPVQAVLAQLDGLVVGEPSEAPDTAGTLEFTPCPPPFPCILTLVVQPGDAIAGRFELERLAGRGGMGTVWRARDRSAAARAHGVGADHAERGSEPAPQSCGGCKGTPSRSALSLTRSSSDKRPIREATTRARASEAR